MSRDTTACALLMLALLAGGCASEPVYTKTGRPPGPPPWRAVLLPVAPASPAEGEEVPVFDVDLLDEVRQCITMEIPQEVVRLISLPRVDHALPLSDGPVEGQERIARAGRALDADLVILPELFSWKRRYYIIHSVARVGVRVKIFDGKTGALLAESGHERLRNQGILKIPVGYGGAVYGPIRGLLHSQMSFLCDDVAALIGEDLANYALAGEPGEAEGGGGKDESGQD